MRIRPTTGDDLPALHRVFLDAIAGLYRSHAFEAPAPSLAIFQSQQGHLLANGVSRIAEDEIAGGDRRVLGFASSWRRGGDWFLASLFVDPQAQGHGVGQALLDAVWDEDAPRRRTITDAIQPVSNALYARRGLIPVTPILAFSGFPGPVDESGLEPAESNGLAAIDWAAYGFERAVDHALWQSVAQCTVWQRGDETVAYSYRFPDGSIGPVAGVDAGAAVGALRAEFTRAQGAVRVRVPGSARPLVETALAAGLRLGDAPGLLLCSIDVEPPTALAIGSYALY